MRAMMEAVFAGLRLAAACVHQALGLEERLVRSDFASAGA